MRDKKRRAQENREKVVLLKFLKRTRGGKYGVIEKASLPYARQEEAVEFIDTEANNYYYGLS